MIFRHNSIQEEKFKMLANIKHNNKWGYENISYLGCNALVTINCKIHGDFLQTPNNHLAGVGCPRCYSPKYTNEQWIGLAMQRHGKRYIYTKIDYTGSRNKIIIICKEHGEFNQVASDHLLGYNCPRCAELTRGRQQRHSQKNVISRFKKIHGRKYLYHLVKYETMRIKVTIVCRNHGPFEQVPHTHLYGKGCPSCSESKGENAIATLLKKNNINFIREFSFVDSIWRYDFFLVNLNIIIECDGAQHYKPVKFWGGKKGLRERQGRDKEKNILANKHNVAVIRVRYTTITSLINDLILELSKIYEPPLESILFSIHKKIKDKIETDTKQK